MLFWTNRMPLDHVNSAGHPVFSPALQSMLDRVPPFKDFLLKCLSERGASAETLLEHSFLKDSLSLTPHSGHRFRHLSGPKSNGDGAHKISG